MAKRRFNILRKKKTEAQKKCGHNSTRTVESKVKDTDGSWVTVVSEVCNTCNWILSAEEK